MKISRYFETSIYKYKTISNRKFKSSEQKRIKNRKIVKEAEKKLNKDTAISAMQSIKTRTCDSNT